jgi:hypothetical protein
LKAHSSLNRPWGLKLDVEEEEEEEEGEGGGGRPIVKCARNKK